MQGFKAKSTQRLISAFNHSPMGYSLPASVGAALADKSREIICIIGDGGLQINIQELATIQRHAINIKIFVLNNHCHGIIKGTQDNWLSGAHHASSPGEGGLPDPDFVQIALAYGLMTFTIDCNRKIEQTISTVLASKEPVLCNVHMISEAQIFPKLLYGRPIEDAHPLLPREEFERNMIIKSIS
jgi:acetolactate synthase I/II/III large subunit